MPDRARLGPEIWAAWHTAHPRPHAGTRSAAKSDACSVVRTDVGAGQRISDRVRAHRAVRGRHGSHPQPRACRPQASADDRPPSHDPPRTCSRRIIRGGTRPTFHIVGPEPLLADNRRSSDTTDAPRRRHPPSTHTPTLPQPTDNRGRLRPGCNRAARASTTRPRPASTASRSGAGGTAKPGSDISTTRAARTHSPDGTAYPSPAGTGPAGRCPPELPLPRRRRADPRPALPPMNVPVGRYPPESKSGSLRPHAHNSKAPSPATIHQSQLAANMKAATAGIRRDAIQATPRGAIDR